MQFGLTEIAADIQHPFKWTNAGTILKSRKHQLRWILVRRIIFTQDENQKRSKRIRNLPALKFQTTYR